MLDMDNGDKDGRLKKDETVQNNNDTAMCQRRNADKTSGSQK